MSGSAGGVVASANSASYYLRYMLRTRLLLAVFYLARFSFPVLKVVVVVAEEVVVPG